MIDLVAQARNGDHDAFERLATAITPRLGRLAILMLRDRDAAEDVVQDVLVKIWKELPRLRDPRRFEAWERKVLVNACRDTFRGRRASEVHASRVVDISEVMAQVPDVSSHVANRDAMAAAMQRLTIDQRIVLSLRFYAALEPKEIAETIGIREGTVRSRIHYAVEALRAAVQAEERRDGPL